MPRKEAIQTKNNTFKLRIAYCLSYTCELDSRFELNLNRTTKSFFFGMMNPSNVTTTET